MLSYVCRRETDFLLLYEPFPLMVLPCALVSCHRVGSAESKFCLLYENFSSKVLPFTLVLCYHIGAAERAICLTLSVFFLGGVAFHSILMFSYTCHSENGLSTFTSLFVRRCCLSLDSHILVSVPLRERFVYSTNRFFFCGVIVYSRVMFSCRYR